MAVDLDTGEGKAAVTLYSLTLPLNFDWCLPASM